MSEAENRRRFKEIVDPWLEYWKEGDLSKVAWNEYYDTFGGWSDKRIQGAFRKWKTYGKRWPTEAHLLEADTKNRIEHKSRNGGKTVSDTQLALCDRIAADQLRALIEDKPPTVYDETLPIDIEPLVAKAFDIYEAHEPPEYYSEANQQRSRESRAYGSLGYLVVQRLRST